MARQRKSMSTVKSWKEVPSFRSEKEKSDFWRTHTPSENLLDEMKELPEEILPHARPRTRPVAVRFDEYTLRRMKALAAKRRKGYQTLLKEFVSERLYGPRLLHMEVRFHRSGSLHSSGCRRALPCARFTDGVALEPVIRASSADA